MQSWDIEANPGPGGWRSSLSVCHWNLNSIWVEDFSKLSQISAFLNVHQFDIFSFTKTFLGSSISLEYPRLAIEGYKLFRCDHPSILRRAGVCLYFKYHLLLALKPDLTTLDECLVCETQNSSKRFFLIIDGPTRILPNSASCIDLIFTTKSNFVTDSGVFPSLFPRRHHQLIFAKVSFTTFFPPVYGRRIWDFLRANINAIRQAVNCVDWDRVFNGLNIDERVTFLTECLLNIF